MYILNIKYIYIYIGSFIGLLIHNGLLMIPTYTCVV